ncbi:MAG: zinc ribbon domain-containing protein [Chloroflexi bacterium]|mgnify:CR=1 FL=1|nr:zinc ribbon domain-containing protein [Chloroflexota bacterium]
MLCTACGATLPDDAAFCLRCGARQEAQPPQPPPAELESEYCDLRFVNRLYGIYYEARKHHAVIARSPDGIRSRMEANQALVKRLSSQGWEPDGYDEDGYVIRLRRRAGPPVPP